MDAPGIVESQPSPMTEFTALMHRPVVTHRLRLRQVTRWALGSGKSPQEVLQRQHLRCVRKLESKDQG